MVKVIAILNLFKFKKVGLLDFKINVIVVYIFRITGDLKAAKIRKLDQHNKINKATIRWESCLTVVSLLYAGHKQYC